MIKYSNAELVLIWLDSFVGLEYKHKLALFDNLKNCTGIKDFLQKSKDYISSTIGEKEYSTILASANQEYLTFLLENLDKKGIIAVTQFSKNYPKRLMETEIPPLILYAKGNLELLDSECFAIVGSRKSLPSSIAIAKDYAKTLCSHFTIVTGIAEGVDSAVIEQTLFSDGRVISVNAGGFDNVYPKRNQALFDKVVEKGLVLSEYPPETFAQPFMFPVRNRIIAGLSKGVLIANGEIKSGTRYTAEYGFEYGKDVFAIPYGVGVASGAGCNDLIKRGANLTDSPKDILDFYSVKETPEREELSPEEKQVLSALLDGEKHVEKLCLQLKKQTFEILPVLSVLEIKGYVVKSGNVYGLCRKITEEQCN